MTEEKYISEKISKLITEGYSKAQSYIIAKNMYKNKPKAQMGTIQMPNFQNILQSQVMSPQQNFNVNYIPNSNSLQSQIDKDLNNFESENNLIQAKKDLQYVKDNALTPPNMGIDTYTPTGNDIGIQQNREYNSNIDINPFAGVNLESALMYAGRGFGEKDPWKAGIGTGLSLLKGSRNLLSGYASGKSDRNSYQEYMKNLYKDQNMPEFVQQGGQIKNSEVLAMRGLTDNPNGNTNAEGGEFVKRNNGMVQPIIGEPHQKNGKMADGVDIQLNDGDKVLSDYLKLRPNDIKELKERYKISLKKGDTPAKALEKIETKIGLKKETEKLAQVAEKLEKALKIKDPTSKELSIETLQTVIATQNEKINTLKEVSAVAFDDIFEMQEQQPKKDTSKIYDKDGKEVAQQGKEMYQQGGEAGQDQVTQIIMSYAQLSGQDPQIIMQQLQEMQPEQQQQAIQMMVQELQGGQEQGEVNQGLQEEQQEMMMQQGGVMELANKYGISPERANQLIYMQMGGEMEQPQEEQIMQAVVEMLQQGISPEEVVQQLVQMGLPQEQAVQVIEMVMQQAPQESMQFGGEKQIGDREKNNILDNANLNIYNQEMPKMDYSTFNVNNVTPSNVTQTDETPNGYDIITGLNLNIPGYEITKNSVVPEDTLQGVETTQEYTGSGYGKKMADVDKFITTHSWYFDTEEKKNKFKEASKKQGNQLEIQDFQKSYNNELKSRALKAGMTEQEANDIINKVGFTNQGVQKQDGLFGAFTSTRPLFDFKKSAQEVKTEEQKAREFTPQQDNQSLYEEQLGKNQIPLLPTDLRLPPSALEPMRKGEIALGRIEPIKQTVEPYLAEQARQQLTAQEQLRATGLPPQLQQALLAQNLASGQMSANDAISKVEGFNRGQQFASDQFNIGQRAKEDLTNEQFADTYFTRSAQGRANSERDWRAFYTEGNLQNRADYQSIENANLLNAMNENYRYIPGRGIEFIGQTSGNIGAPTISKNQYESMTAEELENFKKAEAMKLYKNQQ